MYDIAGLRMMCQFVEDIDVVVNILRQRKDFKVIEERDYIRNTKESGYRSYHVIIEYPIGKHYKAKNLYWLRFRFVH